MANDLMKNEQISQTANDSSGWYPRLRAIQKKIPKEGHGTVMLTQTTDPNIAEGSLFKSSDVNDFITALTSQTLKENTFLSHAYWEIASDIKIAEKGKTPDYQNTFQNINKLLTSMENICADDSTYGQYEAESDEITDNDCADDNFCENEVCATCDNQEKSTCTYEEEECTQNEKCCDEFEDSICGYNDVCQDCIATADDSAHADEGDDVVDHEVSTYGDCYHEGTYPTYGADTDETTITDAHDSECYVYSAYSDNSEDENDSTYSEYNLHSKYDLD